MKMHAFCYNVRKGGLPNGGVRGDCRSRSSFIDLARQIGQIDTNDKFLNLMRDRQVKEEVTEFIASEVAYRDQLITRMEKGIVDESILSELVPKNPVLRTFSLGALLLGGYSLASEAVKETIDRRSVIVGAVVMGFGAVAPVAYRAAQELSVLPLSEDRYVGPSWPVLLALGRSSATLNALRALIADFKKHLQ
jgi:hypothetical protein